MPKHNRWEYSSTRESRLRASTLRAYVNTNYTAWGPPTVNLSCHGRPWHQQRSAMKLSLAHLKLASSRLAWFMFADSKSQFDRSASKNPARHIIETAQPQTSSIVSHVSAFRHQSTPDKMLRSPSMLVDNFGRAKLPLFYTAVPHEQGSRHDPEHTRTAETNQLL